MDKELINELKRQEQTRQDDYNAGWRAGYEAHKKEIEEAQKEAVELEAKLDEEAEDYREK